MNLHLGLLFIIGLGVFGGIVGASLFQKFHIPQVVGYIVIGLIIGESGLKIARSADVETMSQLNYFALGIIGLLVGGELQGSTFKKFGKQFLGILAGEGLLTFLLVGVSTGLVTYLCVGNVPAALAAGIILGAIASATDPASTIDVLWEYRCSGVLTTAIVATVALDDALAMTLYGLGTTSASLIMGGSASFTAALSKIGVELLGSIALGFTAGLLLNWTLKYLHQAEKALALAIGTVLLVIAVAIRLDMDVILATMTTGVVLVNMAPVRSKQLFATVRSFSSPIYVIFFVLVGARLSIATMPKWIWIIIALYLLFRTVGKIAGTYIGAKLTNASPKVQKFCGLGLFAQGGVAVGLSITASHHLGTMEVAPGLALGDLIIYTVTATTLVVQLLGPSMVKLSARKADEIGRDINEDDVIASLKVKDVMSSDVSTIEQHKPVSEVIRVFADEDHVAYPVVDQQGCIKGIMSLDAIKNLLAETQTWDWMVAADAMLPVLGTVYAGDRLKDAINFMQELNIEQIPVLDDQNKTTPVGMLDLRKTRQRIKKQVVLRRQAAPSEN